MEFDGADLFSSYETRTFAYDASADGRATLKQASIGWTAGGCDHVWSDVLPRVVALHGKRMLAGSSCLELGAGCGLVGLFAAHFATLVDITDGDVEEVALIRQNCDEHAAGNAQAAHLEWGASAAREALKAGTLRAATYDVILASQVVYVPAAIGPLVETMATLLSADGVVWLYNDAVSTTSTQAECRRLLETALVTHDLVAEPAIGASEQQLSLPRDALFPMHVNTYLLRIVRRQPTPQ